MCNIRVMGRNARKNLGLEEHKMYSDIICGIVQRNITSKTSIMMYNPIDGEVDITSLFNLSDKKILLPRVEGEIIVPVCLGECKKGAYGIYEPVGEIYSGDIDVVLVPMCAFDKNLNRLGFGKGFYDKFLQQRRVLKIGIAFSCQEFNEIPVKNTDVKMDMIVTEKEIYGGKNERF